MLAIAPLPVIAQEGGGLVSFLPLILIVLVFYLLLIRPQQKRARQQRELVGSLETHDRVVTIGGLYGTIASVDDDTIRLEVAPGTTVTMAKQAVSRRLNEIEDDEDEG
jgi:preprotein translocase subunit YajC